MKILTDLHHDDLIVSLSLLCKRLGAEHYVLRGREWHTQGIWKAHQDEGNISMWLDGKAFSDYKGMTLQETIDNPPDIIISSHIDNMEGMQNLKRLKLPGTALIGQVGNSWPFCAPQFKGYKNILNSTATEWSGFNMVRYHPEFLGANDFAERNQKSLISLQPCPPKESTDRLNALRNLLPDWDIVEMGPGTELGSVPASEVQKTINSYGFLWQHKIVDDGHGFLVHRAAAAGLPVVCNHEVYVSRHFAQCMSDRLTTFDTNAEPKRIAEWLDQAELNYAYHSKSMRKLWDAGCNPDYEWEYKLKPFFEKVLTGHKQVLN